MSGIATAVSSVFDAFAFAGASWIMSKVDHDNYMREAHRHDIAMEKMQKDRDLWNEARLREVDRIQKLHYDEHESRQDIEETNKDFINIPTKFKVDIGPRPKISEYYTPSEKMKDYIKLTEFLVAVPASYALLTLL